MKSVKNYCMNLSCPPLTLTDEQLECDATFIIAVREAEELEQSKNNCYDE